MREEIYGNISAEVVPAKDGIKLNIYGSVSQYPYLVLPNVEAIGRMKDFLVKVIEQEETKR